MLTVICAILLIIAASFCKAVADTVADHFDTSIFSKLNPKFWDKKVSSEHARRIGGYKIDAWHLSMSAMIILLISAIIIYENVAAWQLELIAAGIVWNIPFNFFYNKLLKRKK
jgi:hypothetical protein